MDVQDQALHQARTDADDWRTRALEAEKTKEALDADIASLKAAAKADLDTLKQQQVNLEERIAALTVGREAVRPIAALDVDANTTIAMLEMQFRAAQYFDRGRDAGRREAEVQLARERAETEFLQQKLELLEQHARDRRPGPAHASVPTVPHADRQ